MDSNTSIATLQPTQLPAHLQLKIRGAIHSWLGQLEPHTKKSYVRGLVHFAVWLDGQDAVDIDEAPEPRTPEREAWEQNAVSEGGRFLLGLPPHEATWLVELYLRDLLYPDNPDQKAYTRSTVTSRLAALRWAVREAQRLGTVTWLLSARVPKPEKTSTGRLREASGRDMRGPTRAQAKKLLVEAKLDLDPRAPFLISALRYEGYREHELRQIDVEDVDFRKGTVSLVRKKRAAAESYPLSTHTMDALKEWLGRRRTGPVLTGGKHGNRYKLRIGAATIWTIVKRVGAAADVPSASPHKVRHRACTDILDTGLREKWPEEEILRLTGHSSRAALAPYYESLKSTKSARALLDSLGDLDDDA